MSNLITLIRTDKDYEVVRQMAMQTVDLNESADTLNYFYHVGMVGWLINMPMDDTCGTMRPYINKAIINTMANMLEGGGDYGDST